MKLYLTEDEVISLEEGGSLFDEFILIHCETFDWKIEKLIYKANKLGYPFSVALRKKHVIEAMYNGGVLIRPYDKAVDYAIQNID